MRIAVWTGDSYLKRLIELSLRDCHEVIEFGSGAADVLVADADFSPHKPFGGRVIYLSREGKEGAYALPMPRGALAELISGNGEKGRLYLGEGAKYAVLDGKEIKLTAQEGALLAFLLSKRGGYATREEISKSVWGGASDGLINIYIHYLREKLEVEGEKIIISSRSCGYRISEKYVGDPHGGSESEV